MAKCLVTTCLSLRRHRQRAARPRLQAECGGDGVQDPHLQARCWWGLSDGRRVWGASWPQGRWLQAPCCARSLKAPQGVPPAVLPLPGLTPGVPLRSSAAQAVAALPGAVDEALSVLALLLDSGIQNGLVQEVDLKCAEQSGTDKPKLFPLITKPPQKQT